MALLRGVLKFLGFVDLLFYYLLIIYLIKKNPGRGLGSFVVSAMYVFGNQIAC